MPDVRRSLQAFRRFITASNPVHQKPILASDPSGGEVGGGVLMDGLHPSPCGLRGTADRPASRGRAESRPRAFRSSRIVAAVRLAVALTACFGATDRPSAAAQPVRLVIISPHNEAIREEFGGGFARWHQARYGEVVEVDWRVLGGSSEAMRFVLSEFARKPDGIGIDVFFGGGQEPFYELAEKRLTESCRLPDEVREGLAEQAAGIELRAPDEQWYGAAISSFGILQNLRVRQWARLPSVERWEQLADPRLIGWVGASDPRGSGTMHVMFESFLQARGWVEGWQLLARLGGNIRRFDRLSSTTAKDVALGETAYALAIDFYAFTQIAAAGRQNLSFVLPQDFAAINPDGIAVLRGAPNRVLAGRFLEFVLSDAGQQLWFLPRGHPEGPRRHSIERMPVRPALYGRYREVSNIQFSPFDLRGGFLYDARLAQQRRGVVATLAGALLVDVHDDLRRAWRAVIEGGSRPEAVAELGRVPVTEAEAKALAAGDWRDPAVRNARRTDWQIWARAKYRRLLHATPKQLTTDHGQLTTDN